MFKMLHMAVTVWFFSTKLWKEDGRNVIHTLYLLMSVLGKFQKNQNGTLVIKNILETGIKHHHQFCHLNYDKLMCCEINQLFSKSLIPGNEPTTSRFRERGIYHHTIISHILSKLAEFFLHVLTSRAFWHSPASTKNTQTQKSEFH